MALTEEQRLKAVSPEARAKRRATMARLKAEREAARGVGPASAAAPPAATAAPTQQEYAQEAPAPSGILAEFADFARILGAEDTKKRERDAAIDGVEKLMSGLSPSDYPQLAMHPVIMRFLELIQERKRETQGAQPGSIIGSGASVQKVPWRWADVYERANNPEHPEHANFQWVQWPGRSNESLTWNGLQLYVFEDVPMMIPKCFLDLYQESRRQKMAADQHRDFIFAPRGKAGGPGPQTVAADPTILAGRDGAASKMLRGQFSGGMYDPGAGLGIEVPDADRPGMGAEESEAAEAAA